MVKATKSKTTKSKTTKKFDRYWTLVVRDPGEPFRNEFGAFRKGEVTAEREALLDEGIDQNDMMIFQTDGLQENIDKQIKLINKMNV